MSNRDGPLVDLAGNGVMLVGLSYTLEGLVKGAL